MKVNALQCQAMLGAIFTLIVGCVVSCFLGCSEQPTVNTDLPNIPQSGRITESTGGPPAEQISAVIAWANQMGAVGLRWSAGTINPDLDLEEWVAEGRALPNVEEQLIYLLDHPDDRIEPILVVQGLGFVGTARCIPVLIGLLHKQDEFLDTFVIPALRDLARPECVEPLAHYVKHGSEILNGRRWAAEGLAKIGGPASRSALEDSLAMVRLEKENALDVLQHHRSQVRRDLEATQNDQVGQLLQALLNELDVHIEGRRDYFEQQEEWLESSLAQVQER